MKVIPGIALDDGVAAHYINGELNRIVIEEPNKNAYMVSEKGEQKLDNVQLH